MTLRFAAPRWAPVLISSFLLLHPAFADDRPPPSRPLTNEDVVRLVINGTDERAILEAIATRPVDFDLDEDVVVELRLVGVSDRLIEAMRLRQHDMSGSPGGDGPASDPSGRKRPAGFVVVVLGGGLDVDADEESTPFAIKALPEGVEPPPGMEIGRVSDLALAVLCRTSDHVPDHWDIRSPIEDAPRHGVLFFQPASRPDKVKKFEILRLDLTTTSPIELSEGRHSLIIGLAGRSAGSGAWQLLASEPITIDVRPDATLRLPLTAVSVLRGNRMAGYSVEHQWTIESAPEENPE